MANKSLTPEVLLETLRIYEANARNIRATTKILGIAPHSIHHRLKAAKEIFPNGLPDEGVELGQWTYPRLISIKAPNTKWIIGSDFHIWPGKEPKIFEAFCKVASDLKVDGIILNGDVIDGARISRHPMLRKSAAPKIDKEIEAAKQWLQKLPNTKYRCWTVGNHDIRIDNYIAANANELSDYIISLQEHFPTWKMAYAFDINDIEVRHRFRGGVHTAYNNAVHSGVSMITGHTHQLQVTAVRDRRGTRYGIETGLMADPVGPQFEYTEGQPNRWQQGFVVISFDEDGMMLPPELCEIANGRPAFRGSYVL